MLDPRYPFAPTGPTVTFTADTSAPTAVAASPTTSTKQPGLQYRIHNAGTVTVFYATGVTAAAALANAVIPTGTARLSMPIPGGAVEIVTPPDGEIYFTGITASGTAVVYVTPGVGL